MVFLADLDSDEYVFTYGLFGVQYESLTLEKRQIISNLYFLLGNSAGRIDHLQDHSHGLPQKGPKTTTFVAYWLSSKDHQEWKESKLFKEFWANLPDNAGVWREVMTVPKSRFTHASNQLVKSGIATLLELKASSDEGYWGVYRHRLSATPDKHTDPSDTFASPYVTAAKAKGAAGKPVIDLSKRVAGKIVEGRVHIANIPENMVFVREAQRLPHVFVNEGQKQQAASQEELETWLESIAPHAKSWIEHLDTERNKTGVVSFTTHIRHEQPALKVSADDLIPEAFFELEDNLVAETNQLGYFLDLAHFESAGRSHRGHVQLRKNTFALYGPGGKMEKGSAILFVELCVLKPGDLDAEYVGCVEGTGLMYLRDL